MSRTCSWPTCQRSSSQRGADVERDDARRIDAGVDPREVVVAAQQQRRRSDQQHAQRHLTDDQDCCRRWRPPVTPRLPPAITRLDAATRAGERGHETEGAGGEQAAWRRQTPARASRASAR